jgi:hypothetical protein
MSLRVPSLFILFGLLLCASAGCSEGVKTAKVSGRVTLHGQPITQGKVQFRPSQGPIAAAELGPNGEYTLATKRPGDGAVIGVCAVSISPKTYAAPAPGASVPKPPPDQVIPDRFHEFSTSKLQRTVAPGANVFDFELSDL